MKATFKLSNGFVVVPVEGTNAANVVEYRIEQGLCTVCHAALAYVNGRYQIKTCWAKGETADQIESGIAELNEKFEAGERECEY